MNKSNVIVTNFRTQLTYPVTWRKESIAVYERLFTLQQVDQAEVDRVEARLTEFRRLRDEYAEWRQLGRVA